MWAGAYPARQSARFLDHTEFSQIASMHSLRHHHLLRRLIGVVLLALLMAQGTSLVHAIAHAPGQSATAGIAAATADSDATATASHWGHPAGAPQCQVFEGLLLGQAPCSLPPTLPEPDLQQHALAEPVPLAAPLRTARSYQARAPPRG